jgi:hypothetical protein
MKLRSHWLVAAASCSLYISSFFLPVAAPFRVYNVGPNGVGVPSKYPPQPGYVAFRESWNLLHYAEPNDIGWRALGAPWFANPAIWIGILLLAAGYWRAATIVGGGASLLALMAITQFEGRIGTEVGYWVWVSSAAILLCAGLVQLVVCRSRRSVPTTQLT